MIVILLITHWKLAFYHMTFTRIGHMTSFTMIQVLEGSLESKSLEAALGSDA